MASSAVSSRKRKPVDVVDESPPKRQTRARAAKAVETGSSTTVKSTRITTASAAILAKAKAASAKTTAPTTTRKARTTEKKTESSSKIEELAKPKIRSQKASEHAPKPSTKPRSTLKKPVDSDKLGVSTTSRTRKPPVDEKITSTAPTTRRNTRARSATMTSEADIEMKQPVAKKIVKRVTFKEDLIEDKENKPISEAVNKDSGNNNGIKAKPVRQAIKPRSTIRNKVQTKGVDRKVIPLSPKKVTQVAKSISSSEDELSQPPAEKTLKSSAKPIIRSNVTRDTVSTLDQPTEDDKEILLASPAKRPPPSPFKDALFKSPKKFSLPAIMPDMNQNEAQDTVSDSLRASPKKPNFALLDCAPISTQHSTITKPALLSSPARRPKSPLKLGSVALAENIGASTLLANTSSTVRRFEDSSLLLATPRRLFPSPAKKTNQDDTTASIPELVETENPGNYRSTNDPTISKAKTQTPAGFVKYSKPIQFGKTDQVFEHDGFEDSGHYRSIDNGSEDELSLGIYTTSPSKALMLERRTPLGASGLSPVSKSTLKALTPRVLVKDSTMTPLAVQFGNWLATGHSNSDSDEDVSTEIYTPVAEVISNRNTARRTPAIPAGNVTFFDEEFALANVSTTPEVSMQTQDLHTSEDLEMVDNILHDVGIVAATPEPSSQQIFEDANINTVMEDLEDIEVVKGSFEVLDAAQIESDLATDRGFSMTNASQLEVLHGTEDDSAKLMGNLMEDLCDQPADDVVAISSPLAFTSDTHTTVVVAHSPTHITSPRKPQAENSTPFEENSTIKEPLVEDLDATTVISEETEQYGDENTAPAADLNPRSATSVATSNDELQTPIRTHRIRSKEIRTVARVPLKPASQDSPMQLKVRKGRSKSLSTPLNEIVMEDGILVSKGQNISPDDILADQLKATLQTPRSVSQPLTTAMVEEENVISMASSPFKLVRKGADAEILQGAVVHVDVHTSEGADASGIFVELLSQMGARCVKQWNWNSRSTLSGGDDLSTISKVGITHVVFKDGSKRTLQKVREARGQVLCVGVGWVLDCERANRWLDEAQFAVDTSTIPRGGRNRRKSMEPTMLANMGGNLVPVATPVKSTRKSLRLSRNRESIIPASENADDTVLLPFTPGQDRTIDIAQLQTPLAVMPDTKTLQHTCPPKQSQHVLFPLSGNIADQDDERIREKLAKARRRTMGYAPKVASPLARAFAEER